MIELRWLQVRRADEHDVIVKDQCNDLYTLQFRLWNGGPWGKWQDVPKADSSSIDEAIKRLDFARRFNVALARLLKVSPPTIQRWLSGGAAPHPLMQESVLKALAPEARYIEVGELVDVCDGVGTSIAQWDEELRRTLPAGTKFYVLKITTTAGLSEPQRNE